VAALFDEAACFVGAGATLAALRAHAATADVLHLACHAQFRSDNPRFSALHLADGPLTVDDAETLALQPCTVVLSACETALAENGHGDEHVGLVRAFLVAGASRVLASLWPVDDAVTAGFMAAFYGALRAGQPPAAALACAQSVTRLAHPHPCFWGAFALYGAW
jgi:CHAT domain-containing protein